MKGNLCRCTGYRAIRESITASVLGPVARRPRPPRPRRRPERAPAGRRSGSCRASSPTRSTPTVTGALTLRVLSSPHAHARIIAIDTTAAEALAGVVAVLTHRDAPDAPLLHRPARAARPTTPTTPACSTTSCATSASGSPPSSPRRAAIAEAACRLIGVEYEVLPAVFDPELARTPGRPAASTRTRTPEDRVERGRAATSSRRCTAGCGDVDAALAASAVHRQRRRGAPPRVSHAQLETHGSIGWLDEDGRLVIRTSTPGAVPRPRRAARAVRAAPGARARLHRAGRRRLRRQAGDVHRGPRRARGAAHRAPGARTR